MESIHLRSGAASMLTLAALCLSCGSDDAPSTNTSHETSTASSTQTSAGTSSTNEGSTSTMSVEPCTRVHEGDLYVAEDSDLEALADLGRVMGSLQIAMKDREQPDLSFLGCLHTVDHALYIDYSNYLESTAGLENLASVGSLSVYDNARLRAIEGFDQIGSLAYLEIDQNPMLELVDLSGLQSADTLIIGHCEGDHSAASQPALADLNGFSALASVRWLTLEGNEALLSAGLLDALIANGEEVSLEAATIRRNPLLPESDVLQKLDLLGVEGTVCGNAEGATECFCFVG